MGADNVETSLALGHPIGVISDSARRGPLTTLPMVGSSMRDIFIMLGVLFSLLFLALILQGCKSVPIPDTEWCADRGQGGSSCFHTLSAGMRMDTKEQWDLEREGMLCTKSTSFGDWKQIIEKLCHETADCDYQAVTSFLDRASSNTKKNP